MKKIVILLIVLFASSVFAQDFNSSPFNFKNSPYNHENSPYNYRNSPFNYNNSPFKYGNNRIIRDNQGQDTGLYGVPKADGGINIFDRQGNRRGYIPGRR